MVGVARRPTIRPTIDLPWGVSHGEVLLSHRFWGPRQTGNGIKARGVFKGHTEITETTETLFAASSNWVWALAGNQANLQKSNTKDSRGWQPWGKPHPQPLSEWRGEWLDKRASVSDSYESLCIKPKVLILPLSSLTLRIEMSYTLLYIAWEDSWDSMYWCKDGTWGVNGLI